jgi:GMP synthase (glutamine-hydrolysing)
MRAIAVVHQGDAGLGVFASVLSARSDDLEVWRPDRGEAAPADIGRYDAMLVLGGAMHVDEENRHPWLTAEKAVLRRTLDEGLPALGICLGAQLLAEAAGGRAERAVRPEIGWHAVELAAAARADPLLSLPPERFTAFAWHSYEIVPPPGSEALARSPGCLQAFRAGERAWGVPFPAEVTRDAIAAWVAKGDGEELRSAGVDSARLVAETDAFILSSNALGAALCDRFLALADQTARAV